MGVSQQVCFSAPGRWATPPGSGLDAAGGDGLIYGTELLEVPTIYKAKKNDRPILLGNLPLKV